MNDIRANAMTIDIEYNAKKCYSENQLKFLHKNSKKFPKFHNQYDKQNIKSGLPFYSWVTERHNSDEFSNWWWRPRVKNSICKVSYLHK